MSSPLVICGSGLSPDRAQKIAEHHNLKILADGVAPNAKTNSDAISLLGVVTQDSLNAALRAPARACYEVSGYDEGDFATWLNVSSAPSTILSISLSTASAYAIDLTLAFCTALSDRVVIPETHRGDMELALQEALSNAILHGNLEVDGFLRASAEDFAVYTQTIQDRLTNLPYGARRIELAADWTDDEITISLHDQGPGYKEPPMLETSKNNRGLELIGQLAASVEVLDNGRHIVMKFARHSEAPAAPPSVQVPNETGGFSITDGRVLVVEDNLRSRKLIGTFLDAVGITRVEYAGDGIEGLSKVSSFGPDLILLDLMMPKMDGIEFLQHLRADPIHRALPVLVQSALDSSDQRSRAYEAGATDMLSKPINGAELLARVRVHLENRMMARRLEDYETRFDKARQMQEALLPPPSVLQDLERTFNLKIDAYFETSAKLGGDFWGVKAHDNGKVSVFTVDFAGHGVSAAVNTFRLHTLMDDISPPDEDPAAYLAVLNAHLHRLLPPEQFATMFYGVIDPARNRMEYATAATPAPLLCRSMSNAPYPLDTKGLPLGMVPSATYINYHTDFPPGASLFLYSDALNETTGTDGRALEEEGVLTLLNESLTHEGPPLAHLIDAFFKRVSRPLPDDLTAILIQRPA